MTKRTECFISSNLSFVASALLEGGVYIEKITLEPQNPRKKVYHLSPVKRVKELHRKFISDELKLSPQQISLKITLIKNLPADNAG